MLIIDRYTKFLLTLIAVALTLIALNPWIAPGKAYADVDYEYYLRSIKSAVSDISSNVEAIYSGQCRNSKIC